MKGHDKVIEVTECTSRRLAGGGPLLVTSCHVTRGGRPTRETPDVEPTSVQCWASIADGGPTLSRRWFIFYIYWGWAQCWIIVWPSSTPLAQHLLNIDSMCRVCQEIQFSANTIGKPNIGLMLGHRLRRWPSIKPTLGQHYLSPDAVAGVYCISVREYPSLN